MRNVFNFLTAAFLAACGGGDNASPPQAPLSGSITGKVIFNNIPVPFVVLSFYDYSARSKGQLLGTATTEGGGSYAVTIQGEAKPILIESTGNWCYRDGAAARNYGFPGETALAVYDTTVCTDAVLKTFTLYTPGSTTTHLTPLTHAFSGYTQYLIEGGGVSTNDAIAVTRQLTTSLYGFSLETTDAASPTSSFGDARKYSYLINAITGRVCDFTFADQAPFGLPPYNTFTFSENMRADLLQDGRADGMAAAPLAIGTHPISSATYRHDIAVRAMAIPQDIRATTEPELNLDAVIAWIRPYNDSTASIFSGAIIPLDEGGPTIVILNADNTTASGSFNMQADVRDLVGLNLDASDIYVDGQWYSGASHPYLVRHLVNTTIYPNGPHYVSVSVRNRLGTVRSSGVTVNFLN